jgi:DNA-directed RNA polymerase specialized sigma24 family protein
MVEKPYRRMRLPSELEQPPLSTDLDWMLSSSQTSAEMIVEAVVHERYASLLCLARAYLDDQHLANRAVQQALISVVENRHRFRQSMGINQWLFQQLIVSCRRVSSQVPGDPSRESSTGDDPAIVRQAPQSAQPKQEELWQMVAESGEPAHAVLLFHYLIGLSPSGIAAILDTQEADVTSILGQARGWLYLLRPEGTALGEAAESWVAKSLQERWPCQTPSEAEQNGLIASVFRSLEERSRRKQMLNLVQQFLSVLAVLTILAIVGWVTNQVFRVRPQKIYVYVTATSRSRPSLETPLAIPTELPEQLVQRLPPLSRRFEPLSASSQPDEIRQRMYKSRTLWSNVWVVAQLIRYGPDGFVGPGQVYWNLMWINNPGPSGSSERRLVIAGSDDRGSLYISQVQDQKIYEVNLDSGLAYVYNLRQNNPFYDATNPGYRGIYGFDLKGVLDGSYLSGMLFSAGLVSLPGKLEVVGWGRLLGRELLIVVNHLEDGHMEEMWLDPYTGMVLRWRGYGSQPGELLAEMIVTSLAYETEFPADVLSLAFFQRPPVAWDSSSGVPVRISPRCLTFQWPDEIRSQEALTNTVQIFGDGYFMGQVQMSGPWHIQCKRSAKGDLVACLNPPPGVGRSLYAESNLFWFSLSNLEEVHRVLPGAVWISSDFAFSPDGNFLAFWACTGGRDSCGIYVMDTATLQPKKLIDQPPAATYFAWSPDSQYLSFVVAGQTIQDAHSFVILKVATGEIAETSPFFWPDMYVPPGSLAHDLVIPYLPPRNEFGTCAQSRLSTQ